MTVIARLPVAWQSGRTMTTDLEGALDELFAVPLEGFTKRRNEIVKALRSEGREEEAASVAALRKPVLSAWVTNQLVRRDPDDVRALVELQESLASASPDEIRAGIKRRRELITILSRKAESILDDVGRTATTTVLQRVAQNLLDTSSAEGREALLEGRLSADLETSGLGMWAMPHVEAVRDEATTVESARSERSRREAERLEEEARASETQARDLASAARAAEELAERARLDADSAQRRAERARARADNAIEKL